MGALLAPPATPPGRDQSAASSPSLLNVPICIPECSEGEFSTALAGFRQKLIKCSFAEFNLIAHSGDEEPEEESEEWPGLQMFTSNSSSGPAPNHHLHRF